MATVAVVASGCSITSPKTTLTPYAASDGSNAEVGSVLLRNFLVVASEEGKPGVVVGAVTTNGASNVPVQFTVLDADGRTALGDTTVNVRPGQLTALGTGTGATVFTLEDVPVQPGAHLTLRASTSEGNRELPLPVLAAENQYATITPTATAG